MRLSSSVLFVIPALIWGSTFFVIKFQLGEVDPSWSVSYRFILASFILLIYSKIKQLNLRFSAIQHGRMLLQGSLLFGFNYWLVYIAEKELVSALVAIMFSCIIFLNVFFGKIILNKSAEKKVYIGALLGIAGTFLLFRQELLGLSEGGVDGFYLIICFISVVVASLGNIASASNQKIGLPVIQTNAFGMLYGGIIIGIVALISGAPISMDFGFDYLSSLIYLSVFGSIVAFGSYLTLIGKIGADKAGYVLLVIPVIAVTLSYIFEDFQLGWHVVGGMILILIGNIIVLRK